MIKEPILLSSLLARALLLAVVLATGHWKGGDTTYYLELAQKVCGGQWGGDMGRPTLYGWYLCALSPFIKPQSTWVMFVVPLALQSFLSWLCGVLVWKKWPRIGSRKLIVALLVFDPVLLVFGVSVMSDGLFSVLVFFAALIFYALSVNQTRADESRGQLKSAAFGALVGLMILTRSVGAPVAWWTFAVLLVVQRKKLGRFFMALAACAAILAPQFYWNGTRFGVWSVVPQSAWIQTVAATVEYYGEGLEPYKAEELWVQAGRSKDPNELWRTFTGKFGTFVFLSAKGVARVLFGHVNVEWGSIFLSAPPVGPAWFKIAEPRPGPKVEGLAVIPWVLGVALTALLSLVAYWRALRAYYLAGIRHAYSIWIIGCIALFAATPLVWGDARFRAPIWPLVLILWAVSEERRSRRAT